MSIKNFSIAIAIAVLALACEDPVTLENQKWDEVMALHDEVMPQMSEINRLSRSLREYKKNREAVDPQVEQRIDAAIQELGAAEESMWEWMNNLKQLDGLREKMSHDEIMNYLNEEKATIEQVRDSMLGAVENAKKLAEEFEIPPASQ
jgi:methyl coenzyme M reductase subunit C-like uncharacterized protein (methanogenesis marker protein 7)